ncbi:hypothetical protein [Halobacillus faecis]|uniref:Uncharacterized protein n=1 Tax=Halobacillus faecis TaxID=360184 RepID=A0A511WYG6_9BACI|nr:hypothetical protein [Halobacillus faecis]GEN55501.1 hypothetical protein HFA01_37630 [Halobacillus faecis]
MSKYLRLNEDEKDFIRTKVEACVVNGVVNWGLFDDLIKTLTRGKKMMIIDENGEFHFDEQIEKIDEAAYAREVLFEMKNDFEINRRTYDTRGPFLKVFRESNLQLVDVLNTNQRTQIMKLLLCSEYEEVLKWKGELMGAPQIAEYLGYKAYKGSFKKIFLKPVVDAGVLIPYREEGIKRTLYKFNSDIVFKGSLSNNPEFMKMFTKVLRGTIKRIEKIEATNARLEKKKLNSSAIGVLHALLPWCHIETSMICKNPSTSIVKDGETVQQAKNREARRKRGKIHKALTHADLRRICTKQSKTGMRKSLFDRHIETLKKAGVLLDMSSAGNRIYYLFPALVVSDKNQEVKEYSRSLVTQFLEVWGDSAENIIADLNIKTYIDEVKEEE